MSEFLRTALYFKNVPVVERIARVILAVAVLVPIAVWTIPWWGTALLATNAAFIALTGFVGFCPACYLAGRRLEARRRGRGPGTPA